MNHSLRLEEISKQFSNRLQNTDLVDPETIHKKIFCDVLNLTHSQFILEKDRLISSEEQDNLEITLKQVLEGVPVAYVTGKIDFWKDCFAIRPGVLIPRPETEMLVEYVVEQMTTQPKNILDIGTGSGCILISIMNELKTSRGRGWDISPKAIQLAQQNTKKLSKYQNCHFELNDIYDKKKLSAIDDKFDCIVSNPPYIDTHDQLVESSVRTYEPYEALFAEENGLSFYSHFSKFLPRLLTQEGFIALEFGYGQAKAIHDIFNQEHWRDIHIQEDLAKIPRMLTARRPL